MKCLKLLIRKLPGHQILSAEAGSSQFSGAEECPDGMQAQACTIDIKQRRESAQKHRGLGVFLPTSAYFISGTLGTPTLRVFPFSYWVSKTPYLQLFFLLNGMTAWLSLMFRWKKERTDTRDKAMQSRRCKWLANI